MKNPILEAIQSEGNAECYLNNVSTKQFIKDVQDLMTLNVEKEAIKQAIIELQKFL